MCIRDSTYSLRVEGEFKDPKEMENIVVGTRNGASVYVRDVATVVDSVEERAQETYNNGVQGAMTVSYTHLAQVLFFAPPMIPGYSASSDIELNMQDKTGGDFNHFYDVVLDYMDALKARPDINSAQTTFNPVSYTHLVHRIMYFSRAAFCI